MAFYSKVLKGRALILLTYEKEIIALVNVVVKQGPYLLGKTFKAKTDQQAIKHLLEQKTAIEAKQRQIPKLMGV